MSSTLIKENLALQQLVQAFCAETALNDSDAIQHYIAHLNTISRETDRLGLDGLQDVVLLFSEALQSVQDKDHDHRSIASLIQHWSVAVCDYLQQPTTEASRQQLLDVLHAPLLALDTNDIDFDLLEQLLIPDFRLGRSVSIAEELEGLLEEVENSLSPEELTGKLEALAEVAAQDGLYGLADFCLYSQEIATALFASELKPTAEQLELAQSWPAVVRDYLTTPQQAETATALIEYIQQPLWPIDISTSELKALHSSLQENRPQTLSSSSRHHLVSLIDVLEDCNGDIPELLDKLERLAACADQNELLGFEDICLYCEELLQTLSAQTCISQSQAEKLLQWPILARNYIEAPEDSATAKALVEYLQSPLWPTLLPDADAEILQLMLHPEHVTQLSEDELALINATAFTEHEATQTEGLAPLAAQVNDNPESELSTAQFKLPVCEISEELIDMLSTEMYELSRSNQYLFARSSRAAEGPHDISEELSSLSLRTERYAAAAEAAGLEGLQEVLQQIHTNLQLCQPFDLSHERQQLYLSWPIKIIEYLQSLGEHHAEEALIKLLSDPHWSTPLGYETTQLLGAKLAAVQPVKESALQQPQLITACEEDVSLALPDDLNQELLDGLLQELPRQTEDLSRAIQSLAKEEGGLAAVSDAQRISHTIKGAANTVGVKGIAILTHHLEDLLETYSKAKQVPVAAVVDSLLLGSDCLEEMSDYLLDQGQKPAQSVQVLQAILNLQHEIATHGIPQDYVANPPPESNEQATEPADEAHNKQQEAHQPTAKTYLRIPAGSVDQLLRLAGESMILNSQLQEKVSRTRSQARLLSKQYQVFQDLIADLEQQVDVRGLDARQHRAVVGESRFDPLELDQYNELHTITHQLVEASADAREVGQDLDYLLGEVDELVIQQQQLQRENQEKVLNTRMVPVRSIIPRLQRNVRQTCKLTGKSALLEVSGEETLIDSDVLAQLTDPLMHILRNAIDHGIEAPEDRNQFSKPEIGQIKLGFLRQGNSILVTCDDDGSGLDYKLIQETARSLSMLGTEDDLTEDDLNRLIMHPGFSTRKDASQTSGRGIGMDVVQTHLSRLKGNVRIRSRLLKGCTVELEFPVTLLSTHALLLNQEENSIAISSHGIEQILFAQADEVHQQDDNYYYLHEQRELPARHLESLLNLPLQENAGQRRLGLLVKDEELEEVILIDEIKASKEIIVKNLGAYLPGITGLIGATIMGEGEVVPVLDLPDMIRTISRQVKWSAPLRDKSQQSVALPSVLVVDDSISTRRALSQFMQDSGFAVQTARDGLEAYIMIEKQAPDLILLDLEMPRMNGLELARHLRSRESSQRIPIIMITSRTTEKHRIEARNAGIETYLTKPYSEDALLELVHAALR